MHRSKRQQTVMSQNVRTLNNAEIAGGPSMMAQLVSIEKANPYKVRAYRLAASTIRYPGL